MKVLDHRGNGFASDVLAGLRWIRENRERYGIRIVNISVGSLSRRNMTENSVLVRGVNGAWDDGLVVVVAAGNHGPGRMTVTTPGISRKVITVGCSDDHKEVDVMGSRMVDYSGRGPTMACICKPDIVAPGSGIVSCSNEPGKYFSKSGTSMSTPLVSGAIALLLEKYPQMANRDVKLRLRERAVDMGLPRNHQGWGRLDVERLWQTPKRSGRKHLQRAFGLCFPPARGAAGQCKAAGGDGKAYLLSGKRPAQPGNKLHSQKIA